MPRKPFTLIPEKMEAVVRAAIKEFARYGYSHASTNRICSSAKVSKGALFHNFHSKNNLFFFLIQDGLNSAERVFRDYLTAQDREIPFPEIFSNAFLVLLNFVKKYPDHYSIYLRLIYDPDIPDRERAKSRDVVKSFTASIADTIYAEGKARGIFKKNIDVQIAKFIFDTIITRFVELYFFPMRDPGLNVHKRSESELNRIIDSIYEVLMSGLNAGLKPASL